MTYKNVDEIVAAAIAGDITPAQAKELVADFVLNASKRPELYFGEGDTLPEWMEDNVENFDRVLRTGKGETKGSGEVTDSQDRPYILDEAGNAYEMKVTINRVDPRPTKDDK